MSERYTYMFFLLAVFSGFRVTIAAQERSSPYSQEQLLGRNWSAQATAVRIESSPRKDTYVLRFAVESQVSGKTLEQYALFALPSSEHREGGRKIPLIVLLHGYITPSRYSTIRSYPLVFSRYAGGEFAVIKADYRGHGNSEGRGELVRSNFLRTLLYLEDNMSLLAALDKFGVELPESGVGAGTGMENYRFGPIFLMGHSMGGELALRMLEIAPRKFRAATLWGPMSATAREHGMFYGVGKRGQAESEALGKLAEGIRYLGFRVEEPYNRVGQLQAIDVALRIHHPSSDQSVPIAWTKALLPELKEAGVAVEYFDYPGDDHNISRNQVQVQQSDMEWFRSFLR